MSTDPAGWWSSTAGRAGLEPEERGIAWAHRAEALQFIDDLGNDGDDQ